MDNIVLVMLACAIAIIILYSVLQGYFEGVTAFKYNNNLNNELEYNSIDEDADLVDAAKQISNGLFSNIID